MPHARLRSFGPPTRWGLALTMVAAIPLSACGGAGSFTAKTPCREFNLAQYDDAKGAARQRFQDDLIERHGRARDLTANLASYCTQKPQATLGEAADRAVASLGADGTAEGAGGGAGAAGATQVPADDISGDVSGAAQTAKLLGGVPQDGYGLGRADAPLTVVVFLDLQCPFCKAWQLDELPSLMDSSVRPGKVRLQLAPIALPQMGEDSEAARVVLTRMADQDHAWNFLNLFYVNQGSEGTGYVTDAFMGGLASAIPNGASAVEREPDAAVTATLERVDRLATGLGVTGTPSFAFGRTDADPSTYDLVELTGQGSLADEITAAIAKRS